MAYDGQELTAKDISFHVEPGEKVALVGTNGTGKSSMLRDLYEMLDSKTPGEVGYFRQIVESDEKLKLSGGERNMAQIQKLCETAHRALLWMNRQVIWMYMRRLHWKRRLSSILERC